MFSTEIQQLENVNMLFIFDYSIDFQYNLHTYKCNGPFKYYVRTFLDISTSPYSCQKM